METPEVIAANRAFESAKSEAEMHKQVAMTAAMRLPMPGHLAAIRAAEREYHLALAAAAAKTGLISPAPYLAAAAGAL